MKPSLNLRRLNLLLLGLCVVLVLSLFVAGWVADRKVIAKLPPGWGNPEIDSKLAHLNANPGLYDTIFIGSSRTMNHINATLFDKLTGRRSFNLGAPELIPWESFFITRKLLESKPVGLNLVFLEMRFPKTREYFKHWFRRSYWRNFTDTRRELSTILASQKSIRDKASLSFERILFYLYRLTSPVVIKEAFRHKRFNPGSYAASNSELIRNKGYVPLDLATSTAQSLKEREEWLKRMEGGEYPKSYPRFRQEFDSTDKVGPINGPLLETYRELIQVGESNGIRVIPYVPTNVGIEQYQEVFPIYRALLPESFELASGPQNEIFWRVSNSVGIGHLKSEVADIYTQRFAKAYLQLPRTVVH